jgi:IclR family acetate operon transcriptional repressor
MLAKTGLRGSDQVQSLVRAIALLNYIAETSEDGIALTDLARRAGLAVSTVHRLLTTLEQERYVRYSQTRKRWIIGFQAFVTGCAFTKNSGIIGAARPHMYNLRELVGETVNLALRDGDQTVHVAQVESRQIMRVFNRPGMRVPLHCSAVGKAILSAMPGQLRSNVLGRYRLERFTENTIVSIQQFCAELERVRDSGYAVDDEEHHIGLRCISAPIFDRDGCVVAAVSTSGPTTRIGKKRISALGLQVKEAARAISADVCAIGIADGSNASAAQPTILFGPSSAAAKAAGATT